MSVTTAPKVGATLYRQSERAELLRLLQEKGFSVEMYEQGLPNLTPLPLRVEVDFKERRALFSHFRIVDPPLSTIMQRLKETDSPNPDVMIDVGLGVLYAGEQFQWSFPPGTLKVSVVKNGKNLITYDLTEFYE